MHLNSAANKQDIASQKFPMVGNTCTAKLCTAATAATFSTSK